MNSTVEAKYKGSQVTNTVFSKVECMVCPPRLVFRLPNIVLIQLNSGKSLGLRPPAMTGLCWRPALITTVKQAKPSEVATQPGLRSSLAQTTIALRVKPGTGAILIYSGRPSALREMAAAKGALFSEPRPLLPPANSPPR